MLRSCIYFVVVLHYALRAQVRCKRLRNTFTLHCIAVVKSVVGTCCFREGQSLPCRTWVTSRHKGPMA